MSRPMVHFSLLMLGFFFAPVSLIAQVSDLQFSSTKPKSTKPEMVPLPKPDPNPNGDGADDIWKISDEAACIAAGGVWVQHGESGFCYLRLEAEYPPELEFIDETDESEGPAWNNGWNNNPYEDNFELSSDSADVDDAGHSKPGIVPLPKPDPNPNGAGSDDIWKISDQAACIAAGGVWVQRGETGFCYLKIKPERPSDPKPIEESEGPAWNDGWINNPFEDDVELSHGSTAAGETNAALKVRLRVETLVLDGEQ